MPENFRSFEATDAFGQTWKVRFLWLQNAISIRHADAVDVKFALRAGETETAKVISLPHSDLAALAQGAGRPVTDPWCCGLAAAHLKLMIETGQDMEKDLVALSRQDLERSSSVPVTAP